MPYRSQLIKPPEQPYGLLRGLAVLARNPAQWWSEDMYDEGVCSVRILNRTFVHVARPELVRTVLLDKASSFGRSSIMQPILQPVMGEGLLTSDGQAWRRQRALLAPVFRNHVLDGYLETFDRHARLCVERLRQRDEQTAPLVPDLVSMSLDVIIETLFGDIDVDRASVAADTATFLDVMGRVDPLTVLGVPQSVPRLGRARGRAAVARLRALAYEVVARQRKSARSDGSLTRRLLDAVDPDTGEGLDDDRIVDNVLTFVGAGHETTSVALAWTLYLIAEQPQLGDALAAEAQAIAGSPGAWRTMNRERVDGLRLHRQVLQESMRLYPPVAATVRNVVAGVQLGDLSLKPGDHVTVATMPLHRNPAFWPDPHAFDAERFASDTRDRRFAYIPFGDGPRVCIGASFALDEATIALARLTAAIRFAPGHGPPPEPVLSVTLRPSDGMRLRVHIREA